MLIYFLSGLAVILAEDVPGTAKEKVPGEPFDRILVNGANEAASQLECTLPDIRCFVSRTALSGRRRCSLVPRTVWALFVGLIGDYSTLL
jgi:hypothetical protein